MRHQWPPGKMPSEAAAEADVAVAGPRHCNLRSWPHSELHLKVLHTVELEEVDYTAALHGHAIFEGPLQAC